MPLLFPASGEEPVRLTEGGPVLGILPPEEHSYQRGEAKVAPGDRLVLYTDGLIEQANDRGEAFGVARLMEACCNASEFPPEEMIARVTDALKAHMGKTRQADDVTLLVAEFGGSAAEPRA